MYLKHLDGKDVVSTCGEFIERLYNQINIRLSSVNYDAEKRSVTLHTSRTYYFDSMITNRACDYLLSNGKTIREIFEPGPYIRDLNRSKMSNHLGFNGFIMTNDGKIPFIMRSADLSIGKNTLADSIGASLKTKYAVGKDSGMRVTKQSIGYAMIREIEDELSLGELDVSNEEASHQKSITKQDKVIRDGKRMLLFDVEQLKNATITAGNMTVSSGESAGSYQMMPSAAASVVMLLQFLESSCIY